MPSVVKKSKQQRKKDKQTAKSEQSLNNLMQNDQTESSLVNKAAKLTHVNKGVRDKAFDIFKEWAVQNKEIPRIEMLKLWKGFFYCFWMSDITRIQHDLAERLSKISGDMELPKAILYIDSFWYNMQREWSKLDRHRLDKYYYLMRQMHIATFDLARRCAPKHQSKLQALVSAGALCQSNPEISRGIQYHSAEVQFDEFQKFSSDIDAAAADKVFATISKPFVDCFVATDDYILAKKMAESFIIPFSAARKPLVADLEHRFSPDSKIPLRSKKLSLLQHIFA